MQKLADHMKEPMWRGFRDCMGLIQVIAPQVLEAVT